MCTLKPDIQSDIDLLNIVFTLLTQVNDCSYTPELKLIYASSDTNLIRSHPFTLKHT